MTMHHHTEQNRLGNWLSRTTGNRYPFPLTHQTWLHPTITYLHRWGTHLANSASLLKKMLENGSMTGLIQKNEDFFGEVSINCLRGGQNV